MKEQVKEASVLVGVYDPEGSISKDQQKNDDASMRDDALITYEQTDHPSHLRAGRIRRRNHGQDLHFNFPNSQ
jgi:hypothetical protein